jgi:magnesium transporter
MATQEIDVTSLEPDVDADLVSNLTDIIDAEQRSLATGAVADLHPADLASVMHRLSADASHQLFSWLPADQAAEVLPELDDDYRSGLLEAQGAERVSELIGALDTDDAADVLANLHPILLEKVLPDLEDEEEIRGLLEYHEESAGGLMEADYVTILPHQTVAEATEEVRRLAEDVDPIYAVFAVDEREVLVGIVRLKTLLLSRNSALVSAIMETDFDTVGPHTDQEDVARLMERRDLSVLPVVNDQGQLLGRITIDDVVDVIREEAEEDMQRMSGLASDEELTSSVWSICRGRLVWLVVGLVGAFLSALVINQFEGVLEQAVVLAMFIPVVTAMAGNAGMQSSAIAVQGLATGELWTSDLSRRLGKELIVALLNGIPLSLSVCGIVFMLYQFGIFSLDQAAAIRLALTVGLALFTVIVLAATIGASVPILLDRIGIDPALATGPFVTTSNDILGLVVYFTIAILIFLH